MAREPDEPAPRQEWAPKRLAAMTEGLAVGFARRQEVLVCEAVSCAIRGAGLFVELSEPVFLDAGRARVLVTTRRAGRPGERETVIWEQSFYTLETTSGGWRVTDVDVRGLS